MKMQDKFIAAVSAACLCLLSASAGADIAEVVTGENHVMTFEYTGDKLRIDNPDGQGYMVLRDGRMYVVTDNNGQPMVFDLNSAMNMFGGMAASATPAEAQGKLVSLDPTGRHETLGGMEGEVYTLRYLDKQGQERQTEVVLSSDPRALGFRDAITSMARTMSESIQQPDVKEQLESGQDVQQELEKLNKGVLRYGTDMQVRSITATRVADERFILPAEPTDLGGAMGGILGGAQGGSTTDESGGGLLGNIFGRQVERQQQRVEDSTENAVDNATDDAVDSTLNKAFNKIFGD